MFSANVQQAGSVYRKNTGPNLEPWGTPKVRGRQKDSFVTLCSVVKIGYKPHRAIKCWFSIITFYTFYKMRHKEAPPNQSRVTTSKFCNATILKCVLQEMSAVTREGNFKDIWARGCTEDTSSLPNQVFFQDENWYQSETVNSVSCVAIYFSFQSKVS